MTAVATSDPPRAFHDLIARAVGPALKTAVVHPVDNLSLCGAVEAGIAGLIEPVLVGPAARIRKAANAAGLDISNLQLVDVPHSHAAAAEAARLAGQGEVSAIMKGAIATHELMQAVIEKGAGLRTE